jgi:hypothetical protein
MSKNKNNTSNETFIGHAVVSDDYNPNNNVPIAQPIVYSTKMSHADDNDFASFAENPNNSLLSVTNEMNQLYSLRYSLKCFMICQTVSTCLYASFNPFFFFFLFFNYYVYRAIANYNKKGVWAYMAYLICLNILRIVFFVWTLIAINDFDTNGSYNDNTNQANSTRGSNAIYIFHYGPVGYTVLFFLLNTFIDLWFIKLLKKYYNLINSTSIFEINHLIKHGGKRKYILLW